MSEFEKLCDYLEKLRQRYYNLLSAFTIYEQIKKLLAPNVVGKKIAFENKKITDEYKYFFNITIKAITVYLLIELYKFFDHDKKALSFPNILSFLGNNLEKISKSYFIEYHKKNGRDIPSDSFKRYKSINKKTIISIRNKINKEKESIERLRIYRNQNIGHDDFEKDIIIINAGDIRRMLKLIQSVINILNKRIDNVMYIYDSFERSPKDEVEFLFSQLAIINSKEFIHNEIYKKLKQNII